MSNQKHIMIMVGTRPEAVKMAPVIKALRGNNSFKVTVCSTGQHKEMLCQTLAEFDIVPDIDLEVMTTCQTLSSLSSSLFKEIEVVLTHHKPDWLLIQGDTTTVMVAALCAFYQNIKIGHVEAGLRSFNKYSPFPEEINRKIAALVSDVHYAPTENAKKNLLEEKVPEHNILVTGNTIVDALQNMLASFGKKDEKLAPALEQALNSSKKVILITSHRRENHGQPLRDICDAILQIVATREDVLFIYPVHLNPAVQNIVKPKLGDKASIILTDPLPYTTLLRVMKKAAIILTDSGGIQEEACVLRKPVLILRDTTERMEGVTAGAAIMVASDRKKIITELTRILDDDAVAEKMSLAAGELYGDGKAAQRIATFLEKETL